MGSYGGFSGGGSHGFGSYGGGSFGGFRGYAVAEDDSGLLNDNVFGENFADNAVSAEQETLSTSPTSNQEIPSWAIALIILGVVVLVTLIALQIKLVLVLRNK